MSGRRRLNAALAALIGVVALLSAQPALACAVCYGEPGSPMALGVQAGVLVLLGVVSVVLVGVASLLIFWMRRASRLARPTEGIGHLSG